jgi:hypothetical protein
MGGVVRKRPQVSFDDQPAPRQHFSSTISFDWRCSKSEQNAGARLDLRSSLLARVEKVSDDRSFSRGALDRLFDGTVGLDRPLVLPQVLGPGIHDEGLEVAIGDRSVAEDSPA